MNFFSRLDLVINNTQLQRKLQQCVLLFRREDPNIKTLLTVIYSCLIPLIICANLLLIFGIIKTKRKKFTSSQILFLILFISDLTFGVVQLPVKIYLIWKSSAPTCFEVKLSAFSTSFPICISGAILCVISIDRYINIVHNNFYTKIVNKTFMITTIVCMIIISFVGAKFDAEYRAKLEIKKVAIVAIVFSAYVGTIISIGVVLNVALLKKIKQKTQDSSRQQALDSRLTKTIVMIILFMIAAYLPIMITLNIAAYGFISSTDKSFIRKRASDLLFTAIPCQINAVFNSVIYFSRSSRMKRYYYKLFNCDAAEKMFKRAVSPVPNVTLDVNDQTQ